MTQHEKLLNQMLLGMGVSVKVAASMNIFSLHRRLYELRTGKYDGVCWPVDFGEWVHSKTASYKIYKLDLEQVNRMKNDTSN